MSEWQSKGPGKIEEVSSGEFFLIIDRSRGEAIQLIFSSDEQKEQARELGDTPVFVSARRLENGGHEVNTEWPWYRKINP